MARKKKPPPDICKIRTDRLRDLSPSELQAASDRMHHTRRKQPLLSTFIHHLLQVARLERPIGPSEKMFYDKNGGARMRLDELHRAREWAREAEREIWNKQLKLAKQGKCKLDPNELVARDAEMSEQHEYASTIRNKRPRKVTYPRKSRPWFRS